MNDTFLNDAKEQFAHLLNIMNDLREKCPWDKEQTMLSIRHLTIEEVHELSEAILEQNHTEIKKELGDILLHVVFYAKIASETNKFDIVQVIKQLCEKLIRRHPHIYANVQADTTETVKQNWEQIKQQEQKGKRTSVLQGVPKGLPALIKAYRMQEKAASVGFDWNTSEQVWEKVQEELSELTQAVQEQDKTAMEKEFGDVLFSMVNYARSLGINPEDALELTNKKFKSRFQYMENQVYAQNKKLTDLTLLEMDIFWNEAKKQENGL
jgi:XTP/dITP diphosphohydrolase